ncbi:MAG TPA: acetyl-coenzyme A synthetase, partial [Myxococcales bacterium]|nr:acetyl-coenzyme A synthetase [Myxococcales bacterium]
MTLNSEISSHLVENRVFPAPASFAAGAVVDSDKYADWVRQGRENPEQYWAEAAEDLVWKKKWDQVLEWNQPHAKWFLGGKLNATDSCLDQHTKTWRKNKAALIWEGEPGDTRTLTYQQLYDAVCTFAGALRAQGVQEGDRVAIYMPLVPEIAIAMLACARLGATHSVVFGGFSADSLRDRINDAGCKVVLTSDGGHRKGSIVPLKDTVDAALGDNDCPSVEKVVVLKRTENPIQMESDRDIWWHDAVLRENGAVPVLESAAVDPEHPLFILYTSGTTGKPKGVVHSTGGYMTQVTRTTQMVFDIRDEDVYWCTADAGWITGHSYVVYGPLALGATVFMYEGAPTYPEANRFWSMIEKHKVSIFYTAPTAIRTFMRLGDQHIQKHNLDSLRL